MKWTEPSSVLELLGQVGYEEARAMVAARMGSATLDNPEARLRRERREIADLLLERAPERYQYGDGAIWICPITWPDRVPGLKTWAGQLTLAKIIARNQAALEDALSGPRKRPKRTDAGDVDLLTLTVGIEGASGLDCDTAQDSVDIGFSPARHSMLLATRPALELLAIIGLESLPIVSLAARHVGVVHRGRMWTWHVEPREGGYYHRWGRLSEVAMRRHFEDDPTEMQHIPPSLRKGMR